MSPNGRNVDIFKTLFKEMCGMTAKRENFLPAPRGSRRWERKEEKETLIERKTMLMSEREMSDTQQANGSSGVSNTPAPSMRPKIRHDTEYYENIH